MAISWGSWSAGQSGSKSRLGIDRSISSTSTTTTVNFSLWIEFSGYYANSNATVSFSGGHTGSMEVALNFSGSGRRKIGDFGNSFSRPYGSSSSRTTSVSLTGFAGGSPTLSTTYTIPRRAYSAPAAPSSVTVSRVNDTSADVSWAVPSSTAAPVSTVEIIRQANNDAWNYNGVTPSGASGTIRLAGMSRGNRYRWAVRGRNRDATGSWGYSPWLYQRPLDVANVTASRSGNNIVVSWVDRNSIPYGNFQVYENGTLVATVNSSTSSWTHTAPDPAVTHTYSVRAVYGSLSAAHVYSNTVQLLAAPLAPTNLDPDGGYVVAGTTIRLNWAHNSVDGTGQTAYQLRVRKAGNTSWTTYSGTAAEYRNISVATFAGDGEAFEWQVRTKGDHADYSPWSAVASAGVATRPTVTVTSPASGATITGPNLVVALTFSRAPISWSAEIRDSTGSVVTSRDNYALSTSTSAVLGGLRNGQVYTLHVVATDKVESNRVSRGFSVSFTQPNPPTLEGEWDTSRGAVHITVTPPTGTPVPHTSRVEKWDGAEWVAVEEVPAGTLITVTDDLAPVNAPALYRAISVATVGGEEVESPPSGSLDMGVIPEQADFLNWDGRVVRIRYQPGLSRSPQATDLQLIDLDDGTADPVAIFGPKERHTTSLSGVLVDEPGLPARVQAESFQALGSYKGLVILRPIDGPPVWGVVTGVALSREIWGGYHVSLTHTKAR